MARDPWFDNVKFTLIAFVVFGHTIGLALVDERNVAVYTFVYFWHMPAFVLISGHLSRSFVWDRAHLISVATTLLLPYLIFDAAMYGWREYLDQPQSGPLWLEPHWSMWYLIVLAIWRLATPILKLHWIVIPISIPLSLWAGTLDLTLFDIPKAFAMLPFFVIGLHAKRSWLTALTSWWVRPVAVGVLVWIWFNAQPDSLSQWARVAFLWWDRSYEVLGFSETASFEIRLRLLAMSLAGALAVLSLIPRRATWFTQLGGASLVAYLFHGFVVRYAQTAEWFDWAPEHPGRALIVAAVGALALTVLLTSPPVAKRLTWAVDPVGSWQRRRAARVAA